MDSKFIHMYLGRNCWAISPHENDLEPIKLIKTAHKLKCLCTIDVVFESIVEIAL